MIRRVYIFDIAAAIDVKLLKDKLQVVNFVFIKMRVAQEDGVTHWSDLKGWRIKSI